MSRTGPVCCQLLVILVMGCTDVLPSGSLGGASPKDDPLPVLAALTVPVALSVSGGMVDGGCHLWIADGRSGQILRWNADGWLSVPINHEDGPRLLTRLERGEGTSVIAWALAPVRWWVVDSLLATTSMPPLAHTWGELFAGPIRSNGRGRYIAMPFAELSTPHRAPASFSSAPLVYFLDSTGAKTDSVGLVTKAPGAYSSWWMSRVAVGGEADTLSILNLTSGELSTWLPGAGTPHKTWKLPKYFASPRPLEDVQSFPWIQIGGNLRGFAGISDIAMAEIGDDGTIYVVRNYAARWEAPPRGLSPARGRWRPTHQGLEVYHPDGSLMNRFSLPFADQVRWFRAGAHGTLLFRGDDLLVVAASAGASWCHEFPSGLADDVLQEASLDPLPPISMR